MPNRLLNHPTAAGTIDTRNINPYLPGTGWVVRFDTSIIGSNLPEIEVYHIALDGPVGSSAVILIDGAAWDYVNQGWSNGWDPSQPMLIWQGATVEICWNVAFTSPPYNKTSNIQPVVTLWMRREAPSPQQIIPGLAVG